MIGLHFVWADHIAYLVVEVEKERERVEGESEISLWSEREINREINRMNRMSSSEQNDHLLSGPLSRHLVILVSIGLISSGDLRHERIIWIRVAQKRANRQ